MLALIALVFGACSILSEGKKGPYNPNFDPNLRGVKHRRLDLSTCDFVPKEGSDNIYCGFCPNTPKAVSTRWLRGQAYTEAVTKCCGQLNYPNFVMCRLYPRHSLTPECRSNNCWHPSRHWIEPHLQAFFFFFLWVFYELVMSCDAEWPFFLSLRMPWLTKILAVLKGGLFVFLLIAQIFSNSLHWSVIVLLGSSALLDFATFRDGFNALMGYVIRQIPALLGLLYWGLVFVMLDDFHLTNVSSLLYNLNAMVGFMYTAFGLMEILFVAFKSSMAGADVDEMESAQHIFWVASMLAALRVSCLLSIGCSMLRLHTIRNSPAYDWNSANERMELRTWFAWTLVSFVIVFGWITYFRLWIGQRAYKSYDYSPMTGSSSVMDDDDGDHQAVSLDGVGKNYGTA